MGPARRRKTPAPVAATLPVARVAVDVPLPHLDRLFDYAVPAAMDEVARPGVRVRVRFAGQDVDGYLVQRSAESAHAGALAPLRRVASDQPVLTPQVLRLARAVADRYAGVLADVLRLAVPPRHARAEAPTEIEPPPPPAAPAPGPWADYVAGPAFVTRLAAGGAPRAVWTALPGPGWRHALVAAVTATLASGRGALLVVPDGTDVDAMDADLGDALGPGHHVRLEADLGAAARYRAFLAALRGQAGAVVGTRAAAFAPVRDLGLVAIWDDGDDVHAEPRAPYPHAREVLALRAELEGAAMLIGGHARTAESARLLREGWAHAVAAERGTLRRRSARVVVTGADGELARDPAARSARLPSVAWRAARDGLAAGPVLVQVPRAGYLPAMACARCRRPAGCPVCHGPLALPAAAATPACRWCGRRASGWTCPHCAGQRLRALATGVERTADELGRAFPGARVVLARPGRQPPDVPAGPGAGSLVLATPGTEPEVPGGYAAALLLDGAALLGRSSLRAGEEALRRWLAAAALVRPAASGGVVVLAADPQVPAVQSLVRGDAAGFAERELDERAALGFPPAVLLAEVTGPAGAVRGYADRLELPAGAELLGPVPVEADRAAEPAVRLLVRAPHPAAAALAAALHAASAARSARRDGPRSGSGSTRSTSPRLGRPADRGARVSVKPIRLFGDPVLRTPALPVTDFDAELRRLVKDLQDTMTEAPGAGLAAPQLGVGLRVFTYHVDGVLGHLVNPDLDLSQECQDGEEGCLSFPGMYFDTPRALRVVARGFDQHGEPVVIEGSDLLARAIQHETDHLDGILFIDRMDPAQRKLALKAIRQADWAGRPAPTVRVSPHPTFGRAL